MSFWIKHPTPQVDLLPQLVPREITHHDYAEPLVYQCYAIIWNEKHKPVSVKVQHILCVYTYDD